MLLNLQSYPLIQHWVTILRDNRTHKEAFKYAMAELGRLLVYEASKHCLSTIAGQVHSPMGAASGKFVDPDKPVAIVPILRAGLVLAEHAASVLRVSNTYHLGISKNEEPLQPTVYLNMLPDRFPEGSCVYVFDPMLATGDTVVAALELIKERGVENKNVKVISAIVAPPAYECLREEFPGIEIWTGAIDLTVNNEGFIVPGLGDAGDRCFGT